MPSQLCHRCDAGLFPFETTAEVEPIDQIIGQERAVAAMEFGTSIRRKGFNIFVLGRSGSGKFTTLQQYLARRARDEPVPDSWCYVHRFGRDPNDALRPQALRLACGDAAALRDGLDGFVEELLAELPMLFESDQYAAQRSAISHQHQERARAIFAEVERKARERGTAIIRGPEGVGVFPLTDSGEVMSPDAFRALSDSDREAWRTRIEATEADLEQVMRAVRNVQRDERQAQVALDRMMAGRAVVTAIEPLRQRFASHPAVLAYLDAVAADVLDNLEWFRTTAEPEAGSEAGEEAGAERAMATGGSVHTRRLGDRRFRRYSVNVLVEHPKDGGAPVVVETHPTLANLLGRIEYETERGNLVTDFTRIRPGALHRANGGYLILEAHELLKQPQAYDALKRALRNRRIRFEMPDDSSAAPTVSLQPEEIPLDCKVVLVGEPLLYFLLHALDYEFPELFKVSAEFAESMERSPETTLLYARFIATVTQREQLLPLDRDAMARVIDHGARLADDTQRLSTRFLDITDLVREADYWARARGSDCVRREDVEKALSARTHRLDLARHLLHEAYRRDILMLATEGSAVGQVNGLTVVSRGQFEFGAPVRISARVRMGGGDVVNIEREVELSGPIHSKGVMILAGFLAGRYLPDEPLAMQASLTFEQSYAEIDGDSASAAELCALMSALAGVPVRQDVAVTGSVNQFGEVQAVGGVNEKIEGFLDVCRQKPLTGDQGVLIPASNVQHLMLRDDVIEAVAAGQFKIYPIRHIDEAIELLTGVPAGERDADGEFPDGTVNRFIEDRLRRLAEKRRELGHPPEDESDDPPPNV